MAEVKGLFAALVYVLCQVVVCVLKPILKGCQFAADKCAALAHSKLSTLQALKAAKEDAKD